MPFSHCERQNTEIERQYRLILFFMSECTKSECTIDYCLKYSKISYNNLNLNYNDYEKHIGLTKKNPQNNPPRSIHHLKDKTCTYTVADVGGFYRICCQIPGTSLTFKPVCFIYTDVIG